MIDNQPSATTISAFKPAPAEENLSGKPVDVARISRSVAIVEHGAPVDGKYLTIESTGRATFTVVWQPEQRHKVCYFKTWFLNARGEAGPVSDPLVFDLT